MRAMWGAEPGAAWACPARLSWQAHPQQPGCAAGQGLPAPTSASPHWQGGSAPAPHLVLELPALQRAALPLWRQGGREQVAPSLRGLAQRGKMLWSSSTCRSPALWLCSLGNQPCLAGQPPWLWPRKGRGTAPCWGSAGSHPPSQSSLGGTGAPCCSRDRLCTSTVARLQNAAEGSCSWGVTHTPSLEWLPCSPLQVLRNVGEWRCARPPWGAGTAPV